MTTGLPAGTTDQAGQTNFNNAKSVAEQTRTKIYDSLKTVNWGSFQAQSGLQLKDGNVDNFNLGQVEAYCSENGAVVRKCTDADLNCFIKPCSCSKKEGTITKCSEYINHKFYNHEICLFRRVKRAVKMRCSFSFYFLFTVFHGPKRIRGQ